MIRLVVLACVLRATTEKKVVNFLRKKVHPPGENSGYAYVQCILVSSSADHDHVMTCLVQS